MRRLSCIFFCWLVFISAGFAQIPGDVNGDCCVNDNDLLIALFQFGSSGSGLQGDANDDGVVDDLDLLIILFNFGLCDTAILNPPSYVHVGEQITFNATSCASGTISWTVQQPSNQIQPTSGSGTSFTVTAHHASTARNDVLIRMTYTDGHGNQTTRQHRLTVVEIDLDIFKPKVLDSSESEIPEGDEITNGAQTWVNLDNDDRDDKFDINDNDVAGENEMCKIRVRLKPNNLNAGQVHLETYAGPSTIRVWRQANKGTEFAMPGNLAVAGDFSVNGDFLEKTLWVEGIVAHMVQRQARIKATYSMTPNKDDRVALTVLGVRSMTWVGKENGFTSASNNHNSNTLDACPNFPTGGGNPGSNRVFPDARRADVNAAKNKVLLRVELLVTPIENVNLFLRAFDCDDPSAETSFIDPNDGTGPEANYPGTTIPYTVHEDNRGSVGGLKAGRLHGQDANAIAMVTFSPSDTLIVKEIEFETSQHPGDNYRVVANGDSQFLRNLRNRDRLDGFRITDPQVAGDQAAREVREADKYTSNVLVVWRLLHVENDSMVAVPATGAQRNTIEGNITAITGAGAVATRVTTSVNLRTGPPGGQDDSPNLSDATPQNGRFENGSITIGTGGGATTTSALLGNGNDFVRKDAGISIPFTITRTGQANVSGNIVGLAGTTFTLNITGGTLVNGHNGGTITVAGVAMTINAVNPGASTVGVAALNNIPFVLRDDDAFVLPSNVNINGLNTAFNPAYIWAVADGGGGNHNDQTVPFLLNIAGNDNFVNAYEANRGSKNNETDLFWVVYVVSAYQPETYIDFGGGSFTGDGDCAAEGVTRGIVIGPTSNTALARGGNGALIFRECVRDSGAADAIYRRIVAHEVGHQFGLAHATGLMTSSASNPAATDNFEDRHVNLIRSRVKSPGQP